MRTLWIAGAAVLLDQASKWLVMETMVLGESIPVLGSFFRLTYIRNPGAVFGLTFGGKALHLLLAGAALVLVASLLWRLANTERLSALALSLILGGAVGNMVDRVRFGAVVDFLDFGVGGYRWWVFNLADSCVTIGAGLLMIAYGFQRREGRKVEDDGDPSRA